MFYDPRREPHGLAHDPFQALVAPRPIGWVSTVSAAGIRNLAPFSYYNAFDTHPHILGFAAGASKDSWRNAEETGCFVVNLATEALKEAMNATSAEVGPEVDEFALAGLEAAPCRNVIAPRVAAAPASLECVTLQIVPLVGRDGGEPGSLLVLGEVVGIHIDEAILTEGRVDPAKLRYLARLGYRDYAVITETFPMSRPPKPQRS